uniref:Arc-like DNA binding domain protein n=1 Tax=virus sp. ctQiC1 TaxID=2825817 RepID=A0A8S5RM11_9VIRU|nr:MAG TPA: Arc-like DNA binding domain protein [virus sp. ctQiC1]
MAKSHVFSLRVPDYLYKKIEKVVSSHVWWKRNTVIAQIVECVCDCADYDTIFKMINYYRFDTKKFRIKIEYDEISENNCSK